MVGLPNILPALLPFYNLQDEIVYNYDLLLKGQQIIVPRSLGVEVKSIIHQGHLGIELCKTRVPQSVYWSGINHEIAKMVPGCSTCLTYRNRQQSESKMEHKIPDTPWDKVATDLFTIYGKDYVIAVDYFSKFF